MKHLLITLYFACATAVSSLYAQHLIKIPYASSPTIDGVVEPYEWYDSDAVFIEINFGADSVKVLFMHDSVNLNVAFLGNLESKNERAPEVLLDIENNKTPVWKMDDWWFHVSTADCDDQGQHSNYSSCAVVRPNWKGERNFGRSPKPVDTVEIQIPLKTISLNLETHDTIGLAFNVNDGIDGWDYWPGGANSNQPSTWGNAVFLDAAHSGLSEISTYQPIDIYPNPSNGSFKIETANLPDGEYTIEITNVFGSTVFFWNEAVLNASSIDVSKPLLLGTYMIKLTSEQHTYVSKISVIQ